MAGKARVHELAKELGVDSKTVLAKLKDLGEFVKSASSTVEPPVVRKLKEALGGDSAAAPAPSPAKAAPRAPRPAPVRAGSAPALPRHRPHLLPSAPAPVRPVAMRPVSPVAPAPAAPRRHLPASRRPSSLLLPRRLRLPHPSGRARCQPASGSCRSAPGAPRPQVLRLVRGTPGTPGRPGAPRNVPRGPGNNPFTSRPTPPRPAAPGAPVLGRRRAAGSRC